MYQYLVLEECLGQKISSLSKQVAPLCRLIRQKMSETITLYT